jgi:NifU-like protein involved in Fe-S cluster formation
MAEEYVRGPFGSDSTLQGDFDAEEKNYAGPGTGDGVWVSSTLTGPCGDTMKIDVHIRNGVVVDARFWGDGCRHSIACGRLAAEAAKGREVDELPEISPEYIADHVKGLPPEEDHCARLAHETLMEVVDTYFMNLVKTKKEE